MGSGMIRQAYELVNYGNLKYGEQSPFSLISPPGSYTHLCCPTYGSRNRNLLCGQVEVPPHQSEAPFNLLLYKL